MNRLRVRLRANAAEPGSTRPPTFVWKRDQRGPVLRETAEVLRLLPRLSDTAPPVWARTLPDLRSAADRRRPARPLLRRPVWLRRRGALSR